MGDLQLRMTLTEDVSAKMQQISATAQTTANRLRAIGRQIDEAFRSSAPDRFATEVGQAADEVEEAFSSIGDTLDEAFSSNNAEEWTNNFSRSADDAENDVRDLQRRLESLDDSLDDIGDSDGFDQLGNDAEDAGSSVQTLDSRAGSLTGTLKSLFAVILSAQALNKIKEFGTESLNTFTDLESGMAEVHTLLPDLSKSGLAEMTQDVRELSLETGRLPNEIAPALYQAISASVPQESVFDFMEVANKAATGGVTELETAVDGLTSVVNAYGQANMDAGTAADIMFTGVKLGKTDFQQMSNALYNVVPTAVNAGVAFGDVTAGLATITAAGTPTAVATTQMRQALVELSDDTTEVGKTFTKISGNTFRDFIASGGNLSEAMQLLDQHAKDSGKTIGQLFSSVEAGNAAAGLTGEHAATFAADIEAMGNSAGATEDAYSKMVDTFQHKKDLLAAAWEDVKIDSGEALADAMSPAVDILLDNMDEIREPIVGLFTTIGDLIADVTPLLPGVIKTLSTGLSALGDVLGPLMKTAAENPDAVGKVITSIGTAALVYKTATHIPAMAQGLSGLWGVIAGNPWAIGAAGVAGALMAIGFAIDDYNEKQINESLSEHFGNIELSAAQVKSVAGHILDAQYLVNIDTALGKFKNADKLKEEAEAALAENDALEWQCNVGITLNKDDQQEYKDNVSTFVESKLKELESRPYAATISVSTLLTSAEGQGLAESMKEWAAEDQIEVSELSAQLTALVEQALVDGIIDVNEQAAIDILQSKINGILSGWKSSEAEAELDLIQQKYGSRSGKDLTSESFTEIVSELGEQREKAAEALESDSKEFYQVLNGLTNSGRITEEQRDNYKDMWGEAVRNQEASSLINSLDFESNTLTDTYGSKINENQTTIQESTQSRLDSLNSYLQSGDQTSLVETLSSAYNSSMVSSNWFSGDKDQKALSDIYESMKPDATAMGELIDAYASAGQAVPQEVMTGFNEAMEIGAAAGDADAAWQVFANQMVADPANDALVKAIDEGKVLVPEELKTALNRATTEITDEPLELGDLTAEVGKVSLDQQKVDELLENAKELAGLSATGTTNVNGEMMVEYTVTSGQTMSEIASEAGIALEELIEANPQIENPNVINVGQKINIPASEVEVDASGVGVAAEEAAQSEAGKEETVEKKTNVELTDGEVTDNRSQTGEEELPPTEQTQQTIVNTESEAGNDNFDETAGAAADRMQDSITTAFSKNFTATANVNVTLNYSILNPSHTFSIDGDGSGTLNVSAHAIGGIFDQPHVGLVAEAGPEAIIPLDGSQNAYDLWQQAGERLGMFDQQPLSVGVSPSMAINSSSEHTETRNDNRTININLNGNGNISVNSNMSKNDVVNILADNVKDILLDIISNEVMEEGDYSYEY